MLSKLEQFGVIVRAFYELPTINGCDCRVVTDCLERAESGMLVRDMVMRVYLVIRGIPTAVRHFVYCTDIMAYVDYLYRVYSEIANVEVGTVKE